MPKHTLNLENLAKPVLLNSYVDNHFKIRNSETVQNRSETIQNNPQFSPNKSVSASLMTFPWTCAVGNVLCCCCVTSAPLVPLVSEPSSVRFDSMAGIRSRIPPKIGRYLEANAWNSVALCCRSAVKGKGEGSYENTAS